MHIGQDDQNRPVMVACSDLLNSNYGIFGDSATGKSWVTGLLVEEMHLKGYQVLLIDPEGDFRNLRALPGIMAIYGDAQTLPTPSVITTLLDEASISVVLDLCEYPVDRRADYIEELLHVLRPLREHNLRPQWIVLEEAQHFLTPDNKPLIAAFLPLLLTQGCAIVSYRPMLIAPDILAQLNCYLLTRIERTEEAQVLGAQVAIPSLARLATTPMGSIWLCEQTLVRLRPAARRIPHVRHLYKYLDLPLPRPYRFRFRTPDKFVDAEAASLYEFKESLRELPPRRPPLSS